MNNMILKPDSKANEQGWKKINLSGEITTNIISRKYDYLLSLLSLGSATYVAKNGLLYLMIGNVDADVECDDKETVLRITENGIAIIGKCEDAVSNGVKMLIDMKRVAPNDGEYPVGEYRYRPKMDFRGVHMCIFKPNDGTPKDDTFVDDIRRRTKIAALCGYNYIFYEFWGMFPYEKREYAHWPNAWSRKETEDLISFVIDDLHMTPIPHQNLTSHAGWSRIISRQHVVLDQRPDLEDMWIPGGWCFATTREDTKEYLRDLMDDLIKTYRNPPFLHCSCDKCFGFGSTEEERVQSADDLFANHLTFLRDELAARGVRMAMWADMLYSSLDVKYWKCDSSVADRLPKDILMNVWTHNDIGETEWQDVPFFENKGFETIYSPFLDKIGAKNMIEQCFKNNSVGILQTTWHRPELALPTVVYSGAYMWTGEEPADADVDRVLQ
ncbi:MAG: hypothetical protein E7394_01555 [Ruminococcaceae bacterium]|nr:hypothetical protein [Oscillospiraceae bacterium]